MTNSLSSTVTSNWSRVKPATASVRRRRSGLSWPGASRSVVQGGEPYARLATRSSARSIWSKPIRNGLDSDGTRDIFKALALSDFDGALVAPRGPVGTPVGPYRKYGFPGLSFQECPYSRLG